MKFVDSRVGCSALVVGFSALLPLHALASPCTDLKRMSIADTTITAATDMEAGIFSPPAGNSSSGTVYSGKVPAFCRVIGVSRPTKDSEINFEVWLPQAAAWNHKLQGVGNGAYNGRITYGGMENGVNNGYVVTTTDTGHTGGDLKFAVGHPERIADWGYRAMHVTTTAAKLILTEYYKAAPVHSYFNGCSTGGHEALAEAQRFPEDYDGILAGDSGNDRVHLNVGFMWGFAAAHKDGKLILTEDKLPLIHQAAINACDAKDGVKDGILEDPMSCHFDPAVLLCKSADTSACLTPDQVDAAKKIYAGPRNPRTGEQIIAGYMPGSEVVVGGDYTGWKNFITGPKEPSRLDFWKYWVFNNPDWDWHTFDYDHDVTTGDTVRADVNASDPNLKPFKDRGGKLLIYHGWVDPVGPPGDAIDYYNKVAKVMGSTAKTQDFVRLFMVPGMSHCNGGEGFELAGGARGADDPNGVPKVANPTADNDMLIALDRWVTQNVAPEEIVAAHKKDGVVTRTIPVCAYPKVAKWTGKGSSDEAKNYRCESPRR